MLYLLAKFFRYRNNVNELTKFYFQNVDMMTELKNQYPDWEDYVNKYLPAEVRAKLREKGVPL